MTPSSLLAAFVGPDTGLPSWKDLAERAGGAYLRRPAEMLTAAMILAGTVMVPVVVFDVAGGLFRKAFPDHRSIVGILFGTAGWGTAALLAVVPLCLMAVLATGEEQTVKDAWKAARPHLGRLLRVLALYAFLVIGGLGLFVLPGVLMALAFVFAPTICLFEGVRGIDAFAGSREFFRGRARGVAGRFLVSMAPFAVLPWIPVLGVVLALVYVPYFVAWQVFLYQETKAAMGPRSYSWKAAGSYRRFAEMGYVLAGGALLLAALSRGVSAAPPDSVFGSKIREVRVWMTGFNGFLDSRLPKDGRDSLNEAGVKMAGTLAALEQKWTVRKSTAAVPALAAARPAAAAAITVSLPAAPAALAASWKDRAVKAVLDGASTVKRKGKAALRTVGTKLLEWGSS